jgi:hypothetical protein
MDSFCILVRNPDSKMFPFAEPFWPTKAYAEPPTNTKKVYGTPKVLNSNLFTGKHSFKAFLHK